MFNIAIIGAGQLGSRHLQSLVKLMETASIHVIDPSPNSLNVAKKRALEINNQSGHQLHFSDSLNSLPLNLDVAVIATNADVRAKVVHQILADTKVKFFLLEKVVFQNENDFEAIINKFHEHKAKAWVNCPRRAFDFYGELKSLVNVNHPLYFSASGGDWGLACNGMHFLDLMAFLTSQTSFSGSSLGLIPKVSDSKRKGFKEVHGTLLFVSPSKNILTLNSQDNSSAPITIQISTPDFQALIDEKNRKMALALKDENWAWHDKQMKMPFQSDLTHLVVSDLLQKGTCDLTPVSESFALHLPFLKVIRSHMESILNVTLDSCPIT